MLIICGYEIRILLEQSDSLEMTISWIIWECWSGFSLTDMFRGILVLVGLKMSLFFIVTQTLENSKRTRLVIG